MQKTMQLSGLDTLTEWIIAALAFVASSLGLGKVFQYFTQKKIDRKDAKIDLTDANAGKIIDADQAALTLLYEEVKTLRADVKTLQGEVNVLKEDRSSLNAENTILRSREEDLKGRVERQSKRIGELETELKETNILLTEAKAAIVRSENAVVTLRGELQHTMAELNGVKTQLKIYKEHYDRTHTGND